MAQVVHNDRYAIKDQLNFTDYRKIIGGIIKNANTPLAIGVFGPWGSGKTSLLRMLEDDVCQASLAKRRSVWFTAWKYDREEALWRALILRVLDALRPRDDKDELLPDKVLSEKQKEMVSELDHLEESIYRTVEWQELGKWTMDWAKALGSTTAGAAEIALTFVPGGVPLVNLLKSASKTITGKEPDPVTEAFSREVRTFRREQLRSIEQFATTFRNLLTKYVLPDGRLIVFIDDLDRCLPEKAVEVLEAIKLFLDEPGCVFVIGMDRRVVERGIEIRYRHFATPEGIIEADLPISGDFYLQKMIQLPFFLPPLSLEDVEKYIRDLETDVGPERIPEPGPDIFALGLPPNPRQVKRALNVFHVLRGIADERLERGELKQPVASPLLIKTIVIQAHFSDLYDEWRVYPTLVPQLESKYRNRLAGEGSALVSAAPTSSLARTSGSMDKEEQSVFSEQELLPKYLASMSEYRQLEAMLVFGDEPTDETSPEAREIFEGLSREQLRTYIHLASTATEAKPFVETTDQDLWASLLSGDPARVKDAVLTMQEKEEIEPGTVDLYRLKLIEVLLSGAPARMRDAILAVLEKDEAKAAMPDSYRSNLVQALKAGGIASSTQERILAGEALGYLGDPRPGVSDKPVMIPIPAGEFRCGAGEDGVSAQVKDFHIGLYLVTNAQYKAFVDATEHDVPFVERDWAYSYNWDTEKRIYPEGKANHPVVLVDLDDAQSYCDWLSDQVGKKFRLPSEVEWEKAARGDDGREYPWGAGFNPDKTNTSEAGIKMTTPVGVYPDGASFYGVLDCAGNVLEWTTDEYEGGGAVLRGGSWSHNQFDARCTARARYFQSQRENFIGFRVVY